MSSKKSLTLLLILGFIAALLIAAMSTGYVKYIQPNSEKANANEINIIGGRVSLNCSKPNDCAVIDKTKDYTVCCFIPSCDNFSQKNLVAVNQDSFQQNIIIPNQSNCNMANCLDYDPVVCPNNAGKYKIQCLNDKCLLTITK